MVLVAEFVLPVTLSLIKISICLFYNRIFPFRYSQIASWAIIAFTVAWTVGAFIFASASCRPLKAVWDPQALPHACLTSTVPLTILFGVVDILIDVAILLLPMPLLYKLRVSLIEKIGLFCIFGGGIL
jgi:hypothetical protein